jgi:hypothetical protein
MQRPFQAVGDVPPHCFAALRAWVEPQRTTEDGVQAVLGDGLDLHDVVQMDEYTLDVLVRLPDGLWLVYDTT